MEEKPEASPKDGTASKVPRRLGFGFLASLALFSVTRGCTAVNASPSWLIGTGWFALAASLSIAAIWTWEHTANRHLGIRITLTVIALVVFTGGAYPPIAAQYRREHPVVAKSAMLSLPSENPALSSPPDNSKDVPPKEAERTKKKAVFTIKAPNGLEGRQAPAPPSATPPPPVTSDNQTRGATTGSVTVQPGGAATFGGGTAIGTLNVNPKPIPRRLPADVRAEMVKALAAQPKGKIVIRAVLGNDNEPLRFATDFLDMFESAPVNWDTGGRVAGLMQGRPWSGAHLGIAIVGTKDLIGKPAQLTGLNLALADLLTAVFKHLKYEYQEKISPADAEGVPTLDIGPQD